MKVPKISQWVIVTGIALWVAGIIFFCLSDFFRPPDFTLLFAFCLFLPFMGMYDYLETWLFIIFLVPYVAIPFYWIVLHQIDKRIKSKKGLKENVLPQDNR
jgi:hypothetical protein